MYILACTWRMLLLGKDALVGEEVCDEVDGINEDVAADITFSSAAKVKSYLSNFG